MISSISSIQFGVLTGDEIKKLSVVRVCKALSKGSNEQDKTDTLYDERMGVLQNGKCCLTCFATNKDCPGHFGHIELPIPIVNKKYIKIICAILNSVCPGCKKSRIKKNRIEFMSEVASKKGSEKFYTLLKELKNVKKCPSKKCGLQLPKFKFENGKNVKNIKKKYAQGVQRKTSANEIYDIFQNISDSTLCLLGLNYELTESWDKNIDIDESKSHPHQLRPEALIFTNLPVLPPISRSFVIKDNKRCDDDITDKYNEIVKKCNAIEKIKGQSTVKFSKFANDLQNHVWELLENPDENSKSTKGRVYKSIGQRTGGKEGRMRSNVAGKRVDFCARSVIIPGGLFVDADELGVPKRIAENLTVEEKVLAWNYEYIINLLREKKINKIVKGGVYIRPNYEAGAPLNEIKIGDIIERHLRNGDYVIFNRQPTLREESMMAFKVKIVPGLAFRLPLAVCGPFGADYDGDEMNLHVVQSIQGMIEAEVLMKVSMHIITPQRNAPIIGATQDALTGSLMLTNTWIDGERLYDTMIKKMFVMDLALVINLSTEDTDNFLKRARKYYPKYFKKDGRLKGRISGKMALSMIFPRDFFYKATTKTNDHFAVVKIKEGIIIPRSGPLCRKVLGAKQNSVIHKLWLEYSAKETINFITRLQRFIDTWFTIHQFSIGISDCIVRNDNIAKTLLQVKVCSQKILTSNTSNKIKERCLERILNPLSSVGASLIETGMNKGQFNSIVLMQKSGAKGDGVTCAQMVAFLGQQSINGKRIQKNISGGTRCLYNFKSDDDSPEARGFVYNNFFNGLNAAEAFFTAMTGREGVNATAVKISETGYEQKKISRKVEDLKAHIDGSVRDCNGNIVQFLYGSDGMDPQKIHDVAGVNYPFFVDPHSLAKKLNYNCPNKIKKRVMNKDEIDSLLSTIQSGVSSLQTEINTRATREVHTKLKNLIVGTKEIKPVKLYEDVIPQFSNLITEFYETAKVQYGDMIGLKAGSALGEKTTQCTLQHFKVSGNASKDVTLGLPRLAELLNASIKRVMSTPICTIYLNDEYENHKDLSENLKTASLIANKYFYDLEEITVKDVLVKCELKYNSKLPKKSRKSTIGFVKYKQYNKEDYPWIKLYEKIYEEIEETDWAIVMQFDVNMLTAKKISMRAITSAIIRDITEFCIIPSPQEVGQLHIFPDYTKDEFAERYNDIKEKVGHVIKIYNYPLYCTRQLAKDLLTVKIKGIDGIKDPVTRFDIDSGRWIIEAEGSNLKGVFSLEGIDHTKTMCNHIWRIYDTLGIEAVRSYLIDELNKILSFDGGYVNVRHIHILIDAMTDKGTITAVRREGISRESGPVKKIMFEQSLDNAVIASAFCEPDYLRSVSSSVMLGVTTKYGTGDVVVKNLSNSVMRRVERVMKLSTNDKKLKIFQPVSCETTEVYHTMDYSDESYSSSE
ncbi:MAG TPA: hypothetical protein VLE02_02040 [Nitrosarchaeum sp.]|nr:hypothetical protein [Nitrosarchaeum sp.]